MLNSCSLVDKCLDAKMDANYLHFYAAQDTSNELFEKNFELPPLIGFVDSISKKIIHLTH